MIKPVKPYVVTLLIILNLSCVKGDVFLRSQDEQNLETLWKEIQKLVSAEDCKEASDLRFTAYGHKACGGPVGYIAYSSEINTRLFLKKIEEHRQAQEAFNARWDILSNCSLPTEPRGVRCENGKAVLVY